MSHVGELGKSHGTSFDRSGVWGSLRGRTSVLAGVLAFCRLQFTVGNDPVLYVNPRYEGVFPRDLLNLERRTLGRDSILVTPAATVGVLHQL